MSSDRSTKITEHVHWVGGIDWGIRQFHGYSTDSGTTYNAYLILAEQITLVDTVKAPFQDEMLSRIASVVDPGRIQYVISNHSEMDHSGCLPQIIQRLKPEKVFASPMGKKALSEHFVLDREVTAVQDGERISLGNLELTFLETRMLHWPDSMFTYLADEQLLFSQDAFGMHLASSERFADQISDCALQREAAKYFANILLPYAALITKLLEKVRGLGLSPSIIAPDHGPIWRADPGRIVDWYATWAAQEPTPKALVAYDTMWHSTQRMARAIAEGLTAGDAAVRLLPMSSSHRSDVAAQLLECGALLVGSPTINNSVFPTIADLLSYLGGLRPKNLIGASFGSYGWSGEAVKHVSDALSEMGVRLVDEGVKAKYVPGADDLARCYDLGLKVGKELGGR